MDRENFGDRTNRFVDGVTGRIDANTTDVARRAAAVLAPLVRFARFPAYALVGFVLLWSLGTALIGFSQSGTGWLIVAIAGLVLAVPAAWLGWRTAAMVRAVADRDEFARELAVAVAMSGRVDETRATLEQLTTGGPSGSMFGRLKGLWRTASLGSRLITGSEDLARAKWFFPPTIGVTALLSKFTLTTLPISFIVFVLTAIAAIAR